MSEFDPLRRPKTPPKTVWFEFLLNPTLLEEHLLEENCDPSACELIGLFLYQAELANATAKEIAKNAEEPIVVDNDCVNGADNNKAKALKALAFSVAAILNWNLDTLEKGLPLATVENILLELLAVTLPGVEPIAKRHAVLDLKSIRPEAVFAILLYHRWNLRTAIKDKFPKRPSKMPHVQVPGLLDPSIMSANKKESILNNVNDNLDDSCTVLEHYMTSSPEVAIPTLQCFNIAEKTEPQSTHNWSMAMFLTADEVMCQIAFELGMLHFYKQNYAKAHQLFSDAYTHISEMKKGCSIFIDIDAPTLEGYLAACAGLLGQHISIEQTEQARLVDSIESIRQHNFLGLTSILMQDNMKCVLSLAYRESLEEDVKATNTSERFIQEIVTCNIIRQAMEGNVLPSQYIHMLAHTPDCAQLLLDMATGTEKIASIVQKNNLKKFFRYLCYGLPEQIAFPRKLADSDMNVLFDDQELTELTVKAKEKPVSLQADFNLFSVSNDPRINIAELQHELLITYDPPTIKRLVTKLFPLIGAMNISHLSEKWRLPKEFHIVIDSLPVAQPGYSSYIYVLVAKARVCVQLGMYSEANFLLQTADQATSDISYKLSRLLRWELLKVKLLHFDKKEQLTPDTTFVDLMKRCKSSITTLNQEYEIQSGGETTSFVVLIFLLNQKEWDFLSGLSQKTNGHVELGKLLGSLCKELPQQKNARKHARELWEAVTMVFTNNSQHKRNAPGSNVNRENTLGLVSQQVFIKMCSKFKEPLVLSIMISLITKLYNILKDDLTVEITSEYISLWPTTLGNSSAINVVWVTEAVNVLMDQALKAHPNHPSWLRTQADIHYANSQYSQAIKYYLELGIVMTDFFVKPITRNIFDENVYRRLIRCCTYLHCHTQIVVLCQFLEEVDYSTAFKAVQERSVHDATDSYYDFIWDVTILEYLIYHHQKRGELDKKQRLMNMIGQMELNSSNPAEILFEAAKLRKSNFMRAMAKEYL